MPEEIKKLICITCPMGCTLDVTVEGDTVVSVNGNQCKRGLEYAKNELTDPRRMVTSTVRVQGGIHPLVPVYTSAPVSKGLIFDLLAELRNVNLQAPIEEGQIVLKDVFNTGVDVIASRDLKNK